MNKKTLHFYNYGKLLASKGVEEVYEEDGFNSIDSYYGDMTDYVRKGIEDFLKEKQLKEITYNPL